MKIPAESVYIISAISILILQKCLVVANQLPERLKYLTNEAKNPANKWRSEFFQNIIPSYIDNFIISDEFAQNKLYEGLNVYCKSHLQEWINQLKTLKLSSAPWALQMVDAWAKFPEGVLSGHTAALGDFDECLQTRGVVLISGRNSTFKGRYCQSDMAVNLTKLDTNSVPWPTRFQAGTCYPSSCDQNDVRIFQKNLVESIGFPIESVELKVCYTDDPPNWSTGDIVMLAVLGAIGVLCIVGTILDAEERFRNPHKMNTVRRDQFKTAFSIYTNAKKWADTSVTKDDIGCLHGIRFFTTCWVILHHTWAMFFNQYQTAWNAVEVSKVHEGRWTIIAILNGTLSVDTFFVLGGLLVSYNLLKLLNKSKDDFKIQSEIPLMYLHRYIRITPAFALIIGITATWFPYLRDGPSWVGMHVWASYCKRNWWHSILYFNNLYGYSNSGDDAMCHGDSWYLAADMQFFILSPLLIYPLWKWPKFGICLMILASLGSVITPSVIAYEFNLLPTFMPYASPSQSLDYTVYTYMKPWTRSGPYMVGIWTGYFLHRSKEMNLDKIPKKVLTALLAFGWCLSSALAIAIVFGLSAYYDRNATIPTIFSAIYGGTHRFFWGIAIAWIIIVCKLGHGSWINEFLSWKAFVPLGRLTFCVYLISFQLQMLFHLSVKHPTGYDVYTSTNLFFSHTVICFCIGFICHITMELPFLTLDKLIFRKDPPQKGADQGITTYLTNNGIENQSYQTNQTKPSLDC